MEVVQFDLKVLLNFFFEQVFHRGAVDCSWHFDTLEVAGGLNVTLKVEKIWVEEVEDTGNFILKAKLTLLETKLTLLETG